MPTNAIVELHLGSNKGWLIGAFSDDDFVRSLLSGTFTPSSEVASDGLLYKRSPSFDPLLVPPQGHIGLSEFSERHGPSRHFLHLCLIEKTLYEINYELANRPDWVPIPIGGLISILKPDRAEKNAYSGSPTLLPCNYPSCSQLVRRKNRENVMAASNVPICEDEKLFRAVTALGAELRRQGVWSFAGKTNIDLIDLAYAAIAVSAGPDRSDRAIAVGELTRTVTLASPNSVNSA
jgi:hypothetical protein